MFSKLLAYVYSSEPVPDETPVPTDETPVPTDETPVPTDETSVTEVKTPVKKTNKGFDSY